MTPLARSRRLVLLSALASASLFGALACGSDDDDGGGSSAGGGTASATTAARTYCQLSNQLTQTCDAYAPLGAACAQALYAQGASAAGIDECAAGVTAAYLPAYVEIQTMCGAFTQDCSCVNGACTDGAAPAAAAYQDCVHAELATLTPTPVQAKLKGDFCATCPPTSAADDPCTTFFDVTDGGAGSAGAITLVFADTTAAQVDEACTGGALLGFDAGLETSCSSAGFARCVAGALATQADGGDATSALPAACLADGGT